MALRAGLTVSDEKKFFCQSYENQHNLDSAVCE